MLAIGFERFGGPEVMTLLSVPIPHAGPGQIRLRVEAAGVNLCDAKARSGLIAYAWPKFFCRHGGPFVVGWDVAGIVDEVGAGVDGRVLPGDAVVALVDPQQEGGAQAEYVVTDARSVVRAPRGKTPVQAATLLMNALAARTALDSLAVHAGATIAVTGAAGAVGGYAIELAKADGLQVIADAAPADRELVSRLGADIIVDRGSGFAKDVLADHGQVEGVVDTADLGDAITPAVADGGTIFSVRGFTGTPTRNIRWTHRPVHELLTATAKLEQLRDTAERDLLTLRVAATCLPEEAVEAHRRIEAGGVRGRIVFIF